MPEKGTSKEYLQFLQDLITELKDKPEESLNKYKCDLMDTYDILDSVIYNISCEG